MRPLNPNTRRAAGIGDEPHLAALPRLETGRGAGRDVEPEPARLLAVERKRRVGLVEMIVRADLDRPVAGIGDRQGHGSAGRRSSRCRRRPEKSSPGIIARSPSLTRPFGSSPRAARDRLREAIYVPAHPACGEWRVAHRAAMGG